MSQVSFRIENVERLKDAFKRAPALVAQYIWDMSAEMAFFLEAESKDRAPTDVGRLKGSISTSLGVGVGGLGAIVKTGTNYAAAVHEGSKPHWTSIRNLEDWSRRKGINPYIVQLAIAKHGTKPQPFMKEAVEENGSGLQRIADRKIQDAVDAVARSTM